MIGIKKSVFNGIRSPSICKLHGAVITHAVSIQNKEPTILFRFYCIVIRSYRMIYEIAIKENSFYGIRSPSICKLHGAAITHAVFICNKEPNMLFRFYCIVIRSSRMLYVIGIMEISFVWHQISLDLQTTWVCHYACSINLIIQHVEHTLYWIHIQGMLQGIRHQKEQLHCLLLF